MEFFGNSYKLKLWRSQEHLPLRPATTVTCMNRHYKPVSKSFLLCSCADRLELARLLQAAGKPTLLSSTSFSDSLSSWWQDAWEEIKISKKTELEVVRGKYNEASLSLSLRNSRTRNMCNTLRQRSLSSLRQAKNLFLRVSLRKTSQAAIGYLKPD